MAPFPRALAGAVVLLALGTALPSAHATEVNLTFPAVGALAPGDERTVVGEFLVRDAPGNGTRVTFEPLSPPAWLEPRLDPAQVRLNATPGAEARGEVALVLRVLPGAPALAQHTLAVRVEAANGTLVAGNTADVPLRVSFVGSLQVEPLEETLEARTGDPVEVGLRVVNQGNGPALVAFEPAVEGSAVTVLAPSPIVVETEGALRDRVVNVSVLANSAGEHPILLRWSSRHAFDPSVAGDSGQVSVQLQARDAGVPAASPWMLLALAGVAALALRGRVRGG